MTFTKEDAARYGARGGKASRKLNLNLERVEKLLPPMDSPENVKRRIEMLINWGSCGMIPGTVLGAAMSGCRVWFQIEDLEMERERVLQLSRRVKELERELAKVQPGRRGRMVAV